MEATSGIVNCAVHVDFNESNFRRIGTSDCHGDLVPEARVELVGHGAVFHYIDEVEKVRKRRWRCKKRRKKRCKKRRKKRCKKRCWIRRVWMRMRRMCRVKGDNIY